MAAFVVMIANAYADDNFQKTANQYCGLYGPESLSSLGEGADLQEIFDHTLSSKKPLAIKN